MKVINMDDVTKEPLGGAPMHIGKVMTQVLVSDSKDNFIDTVTFSKGARNRLHTHPVDQVMIVTAGQGIVATDKEERMVSVGDVILISAGEKHWHGATEDSDFTHLFVLSKNFSGERATIVETLS